MAKFIFCLLFAVTCNFAWGQNDYIVKTASQASAASTEEERFIEDNFPFQSLCDWKPGTRFMYILEEKYASFSTFLDYETNRPVDNAFFQHKVLTLENIEEVETKRQGRSYRTTKFVFDVDGKKYYHEFKNQRLNEICLNTTRAHIKGLVYLKDIDTAREILTGKTIHTKTKKLRIDSPNSANGYREVDVPVNTALTVTTIGVGNRETPAKIIFTDKNNNSYYWEVAFSTTNSGYAKTDFQGERITKYFPNVFTFTDQYMAIVENIKGEYTGQYVYPKQNLDAKTGGRSVVLFRYTPLKIMNIDVASNQTSATLSLRDESGTDYLVPVSLKYDVIIKNSDYIKDLFGQGNLRKQYPYINDEHWKHIVNGTVQLGMTKDECRLSLGSPVQITANLNSRYETWLYQGKVLEFEDGKLIRVK